MRKKRNKGQNLKIVDNAGRVSNSESMSNAGGSRNV